MAYRELVKNFNRIRDYMRDFYVYGFKSREDYTEKSARSYDNEHRRIESWLADYMRFRYTDGKQVFISIDTNLTRHNPFYNAWKAKSFTSGDILLHFVLMDIFSCAPKALSLKEIQKELDPYTNELGAGTVDPSTLQKKLKEYVNEGIVACQKQGKIVYYQRAKDCALPSYELLDFFSEVAPCGVIGSFLLDKKETEIADLGFVENKQNQKEAVSDYFAFKHHYITSALDSEILCELFMAMHQKKEVTLTVVNRKSNRKTENTIIPLQVMISVQNGRQYLMGYAPKFHQISPYRIDNIISVKLGEICEQFDELRKQLNEMKSHMWGVSTKSSKGTGLEHVEFTIGYGSDETYIPKRLEREKRCGTVTHLNAHASRFFADVYDAQELIPWIRTFICRITDIQFSNKELEARFKDDIQKMEQMYGLSEKEDGGNDGI